MSTPKAFPPPVLPAERLAEVADFVAKDEGTRRFFLLFDSLRIRGVSPTVAASIARVMEFGPDPEPPKASR